MINVPVTSSRKDMDYFVITVQELSLARDLETVMRIVRKAARELTGADGATFVLRDKDNCYYADEDAISPLWKGSRFPIHTCISGWTMLHKKAVAIDDIYLDDRIPHDAYRPTFVKSLAMVPIRTIEPIGAIGNYWASPHSPSEEEIKLLQSLADITAVTMENVTVYAELEQRVKDRTADLEEANRSLEAFSHSVSHDLKAPLRAIASYVQILVENIEEKLEAPDRDTTNRIVTNVGRMNNLIDGLLTFSKMGKQQLAKSDVCMQEMVEEICEGFKDQAGDRLIEFHIGSLSDSRADPLLIGQVWANLVSNAVKYTGKKEKAVIEIGFQDKGEAGVYWIKDNGAGFSMVYADKLFGVFQRMHSSSEFEGMGIGLSLAQRIIEKHDGKMWAEAKLNEGATFYFSLPKENQEIARSY